MTLTYGEVADILKIVEASSLDEVVLELGDTKLIVRRGGAAGAATPALASSAAPVARAAANPAAAAQTAPQPSAVSASSLQTASTEIRAPMVGTFYRKPSPSDPVFIDVGSTVKAGDPLCLIEVMKLYNTITAPVAGTVEAILAYDAALVAFDQVLIRIKPD